MLLHVVLGRGIQLESIELETLLLEALDDFTNLQEKIYRESSVYVSSYLKDRNFLRNTYETTLDAIRLDHLQRKRRTISGSADKNEELNHQHGRCWRVKVTGTLKK